MRRKLWFFGDSFCAMENNWVLQLQKNLGNPTIANLGIGGSSIAFLLDDILKKLYLIEKNDYVVICFTDHQRHFFRGHHFNVGEAKRQENYLPNSYSRPNDTKRAYLDYIDHLLDYNAEKRHNAIIVSHIVNEITPRILCKNIIYFNSINDDYSEYPFFTDRIYQPKVPSFYHHFVDYAAKHLQAPDVDELVFKIMATPNHWYDSQLFFKSFWETYNPVFELIGGATDLRAKI